MGAYLPLARGVMSCQRQESPSIIPTHPCLLVIGWIEQNVLPNFQPWRDQHPTYSETPLQVGLNS